MTERLLSGVPHLSSTDDVYRGYLIPKGQIPQLYILRFRRSPFSLKDPL
jgi:hypothetical protein